MLLRNSYDTSIVQEIVYNIYKGSARVDLAEGAFEGRSVNNALLTESKQT